MNDSVVEVAVAETALDGCVELAGKPIPGGVRERMALLLARLGALLNEVADERLASAGLGGRDYGILAILATDGPESQYELARMLGKAPGMVVGAIDKLEDAGLVERTRDPADRRRSRVTVTAAGTEALARADEIAERTLDDIFPRLDPQELGQLRKLLAKGVAPRA
jgi:MarR family transcriptional regulator, lower aerobic nicotinate degradation pathway regulator